MTDEPVADEGRWLRRGRMVTDGRGTALYTASANDAILIRAVANALEDEVKTYKTLLAEANDAADTRIDELEDEVKQWRELAEGYHDLIARGYDEYWTATERFLNADYDALMQGKETSDAKKWPEVPLLEGQDYGFCPLHQRYETIGHNPVMVIEE